MSDDVLITPGSRKMEFKDSSANIDAKIETDASGNLKITNAGGDIEIGDTSSDVFIGDGTNNIDIVFEQSGEIRGTSGVTLTLGASGSNVAMATDLSLGGNDITNVGNLTMSGNLTVTGTTTTLSTATLDVEDKNITLNKGSGDTSGSANGAGITIQDAVNSSTDATILWDATNDEFDFSHPIKVAGSVGVTNIVTNKVVKFNGSVLDDSNITDTGSLITLGSNTVVSGNIRQTVNNVGIPTVYGQYTLEATDAQLDLVSSSSGTWGSAINFVEGASTSANTDVWSIARKTTSGDGDSSLNFNFGTSNQHDNNLSLIHI